MSIRHRMIVSAGVTSATWLMTWSMLTITNGSDAPDSMEPKANPQDNR
jgi:hypothetical protein